MPRLTKTEKEEFVTNLRGYLADRDFLLADCCGLSVADLTSLRKQLNKVQARLQVVKNRLLLKAMNEQEQSSFGQYLVGPTALVIGDTDLSDYLRVLHKFAKNHDDLPTLKSAFYKGTALDSKSVKEMANLPSREVLLGRVVCALNSPMSGLVYCLSGVTKKLLIVLNRISQNKESQSNEGGNKQ